MNQQFRHKQFPAGNPLANVLVVIVGIVVISLSLALGFVVFVGIAGFLLIMGVVMSIRGWWLRRSLGAGKADSGPGKKTSSETHQIIEGEYREIRTREETRRKP